MAQYEITKDFEKFLEEQSPKEMPKTLGEEHKANFENRLGDIMKGYLGEYEHGTAEITTLFDEVSETISVPGTNPPRSLSGWSMYEEGTTPEQEAFAMKMNEAYLKNLSAIFKDLLLMAKAS